MNRCILTILLLVTTATACYARVEYDGAGNVVSYSYNTWEHWSSSYVDGAIYVAKFALKNGPVIGVECQTQINDHPHLFIKFQLDDSNPGRVINDPSMLVRFDDNPIRFFESIGFPSEEKSRNRELVFITTLQSNDTYFGLRHTTPLFWNMIKGNHMHARMFLSTLSGEEGQIRTYDFTIPLNGFTRATREIRQQCN